MGATVSSGYGGHVSNMPQPHESEAVAHKSSKQKHDYTNDNFAEGAEVSDEAIAAAVSQLPEGIQEEIAADLSELQDRSDDLTEKMQTLSSNEFVNSSSVETGEFIKFTDDVQTKVNEYEGRLRETESKLASYEGDSSSSASMSTKPALFLTAKISIRWMNEATRAARFFAQLPKDAAAIAARLSKLMTFAGKLTTYYQDVIAEKSKANDGATVSTIDWNDPRMEEYAASAGYDVSRENTDNPYTLTFRDYGEAPSCEFIGEYTQVWEDDRARAYFNNGGDENHDRTETVTFNTKAEMRKYINDNFRQNNGVWERRWTGGTDVDDDQFVGWIPQYGHDISVHLTDPSKDGPSMSIWMTADEIPEDFQGYCETQTRDGVTKYGVSLKALREIIKSISNELKGLLSEENADSEEGALLDIFDAGATDDNLADTTWKTFVQAVGQQLTHLGNYNNQMSQAASNMTNLVDVAGRKFDTALQTHVAI